MKQELTKIYAELAAGKLSQRETLARIKALKETDRTESIGTLLASPVWEPAASQSEAAVYVQHQVLLWDLPQVVPAELESLLAGSRCSSLPAAQWRNAAEAYIGVALAFFETIQRILQGKPHGCSFVQLAVADRDEGQLLAGLSGLIETAALENPDIVGQVVFVRPNTTAADLARQLATGSRNPQDRVVRYSGNARLSRRWRPIDEAPCVNARPSQDQGLFKEHGVYLITGGLGGLGVLLAKEILKRTGGAKVVLTGRAAAGGAKLAALESVAQQDDRIAYHQADVTDPEQIERLLSSIARDYGQLNGIIHSAAIVQDDFILKKTSEKFSAVLLPKVAGTYHLDKASQAMVLDFFLLFSSIASWSGNAGQADYAAANGFMDQFAGYRNGLVMAGQRHGKTLTLAWPHWLEGGMHIDPVSMALLQQRTGLRSLETEQGMEVLYRCLGMPQSHVMVMRGDIAAMRRAIEAKPASRQENSSVEKRGVPAGSTESDALAGKTREFLRQEFSSVLKIPVQRIETRVPLENYGIDSILAMNLTARLEATFGTLAKTLFFEYQTIGELADYFARSHGDKLNGMFAAPVERGAKTASVQPLPASQALPGRGAGRRQRFLSAPEKAPAQQPLPPVNEPIAIVGLSGRYPESPDIGAFWRNLRDGKDCIVEIPKQRWDWRQHYSEDRTKEGAHYSKWGGFIAGVDEFDPRFFNIAPREARTIDPQERLFLQHAWMAIEDAGYTRDSLQISQGSSLPGQVGVYAGVMYGEYNLSGSLASIANRVSYFLNLHGPSLTLDTMCSSSLTAIHMACQDLRLGCTSLGIAGGVNVSIHPNKYTMLSGAQFISSDGHCQSFGEGGNGYIPGEGVGVAILKRLSDAERDGNHIYGIIRGSALNHGGKTNGYTVPNPVAQAEVIRRALAEAGIDPRHISYIEAHGTGTKLGDPIEIAALTRAFYEGTRSSSKEAGFCLIGSAKSNIGHCESAAGIAGVTKVLLQMKHAAIVPSLHSTKLNPHIDFGATPFIVNQSLRTWEQPQVDGQRLPRIAGISSFGAGGSNAHVIIEEYRTRKPPVVTAGKPSAIPLSARTVEQLEQRARDLLAFIEGSEEAIDLHAMAYTLQVGREGMDERVAFIAVSCEDLAAKLKSFIGGSAMDGEIYRARVKKHKDELSRLNADPDFESTLEGLIVDRQLPSLMALWVKGLELDWRRLTDAGSVPRLMSLPAYPFARESYWIEPAVQGVKTAVLHPLVHINTSNLVEQGYASRFTGTEPFLEEGSAAGDKTLPALLALEMLRAAVDLAAPQRPEAGLWELRQTVWGEPIALTGEQTISLALFTRDNDAIDVEIYRVEGRDDRVHCQSHVLFSRLPAPGQVDVAGLKARMRSQPDGLHSDVSALYRGDGQVLAEMHRSARSGPDHAGFGLPPDILRTVSQLLDSIGGQSRSPISLECLRFAFPCPEEVVLWVRHTSFGGVDIDVCDQEGHVCIQMIGLQTDAGALPAIVEPAEIPMPVVSGPVAEAVAPAPVIAVATGQSRPISGPREIVPASTATSALALQFRALQPKPTDVALAASVPVPTLPAATKPKIALTDLSATPADAGRGKNPSRSVRLFDQGDGIFAIDLDAPSLDEIVESLPQVLKRARQESSLKVLLLIGRQADAWRGGRKACNQAIQGRLLSALAAFPYPVVAALPEGATGAGLLLATVCDFMVCGEEGRYGYTNGEQGIFPSAEEECLFRERLGEAVADDFLYRSTLLSGRQLREKGWACRIVPSVQVEAEAQGLAAHLAQKSQLALGLLKTHLGHRLSSLVEALAVAPVVSNLQAKSRSAESSALVIQLGADRGAYGLQDLITDLKAAIKRVAKSTKYKSIVLAGAQKAFLPQAGQAIDATIVAKLKDLVQGCPLPVITVFERDADGLAWLFGLFCDVAVYRSDCSYSVSGLWSTAALAQEVAALCTQRLGPVLGQEVCLIQRTYFGSTLRQRTGTLSVVDGADVWSEVLRLAAFWDQWPRAVVTAWKKARVTHLQSLLPPLPAVPEERDECAPVADPVAVAAPTSIPLRSTVVTLTAYPEGVVLVGMQDREAKNMFSEALVSGLKEAFAHIEATPAYKAVVLTGYDSYFATGGTRETLLAIQEGQAHFTNEKVFQLPMDCSLPVIAALQGHGIGGGWSFGMFADLVLLSEESRYLSPYMGYGFTPGAGSTLIFPAKIGYDLARETLLTAQEISGQALKERAVPLRVLPRREVVPAAIELATRMASQPRRRLVGLKRLWTHGLRQQREDIYAREVEMHERTFVNNADTLEHIQAKFQPENIQTLLSAANVPQSAPPAVSASAIVDKLKAMLAQELFLKPGEIDEDTQFIELGLDSITSVTWIRKINSLYGTDIEATKVYSHPTLRELSRLVASAAAIESAPISASAEVQLPASAQAAAASVVSPGSADRDNLDSVIARLKTMLAKELHLQTEEIEENAQFIDMGLDSITGVTWVRKINEHYGTSIEATKVYSHPTLGEIGRLVKEEAEKADDPVKAAPIQLIAARPTSAQPVLAQTASAAAQRRFLAPPAARPVLVSWRRQALALGRMAPQATELAGMTRPIAVIGMAGQFPKARNIDEFWCNLAEGRDCISVVPDSRWSLDRYYQAGAAAAGKTNSKWFGGLDEYDRFDPLFFNISPTEAEGMEPQQRLFLQAAWHCIENAGYNPHALSGSQCGVFVGCGPSEYHQIFREQQLSAQGFTGAASSILAARISYFLNLRGPCLAIETACSSSLVAIANACDSLNNGNSDLALAGGVYVMAGPNMHVMAAQAGMLSTDGRCFSFDQRANGFVPGEAVGVLMLKRLADAERDQDRIQGVIEGWGVNQDGKTNGITAPSEESQTRLIQSVYRKFAIDPAGIQLIEAHGTGTKLGDPIEVEALKAAFKPFTDKIGYCALSSVKSNIGHCLTAAGAAGMIKLILALRHQALPPTINYQRCNEHIQLQRSPFYVNDCLQSWRTASGERRRAAISSFGFSGTNAHIVVAEGLPHIQAKSAVFAIVQNDKVIVPLSARTEEQLYQKVRDLLASLRGRKEPVDLLDLAYTLQVGRTPMEERLGFLVDSIEGLGAKLEAFLIGEADIEDVYRGQIKRHKEGMKLISQDDEMRATIIDKWLGQRKLSKLLDLWVKGMELDWNLLYGEVKPQRIEIPNYPFAKDCVWIEGGNVLSGHGLADRLHPLVHRNVSVLSRQRYCSAFSGEECFCDEAIDGSRVLSPSSLLEMARAAVAEATRDMGEPAVIELCRISWGKPLQIAGGTEVAIDLSANDDDSVSFEIYTMGEKNAVHVQGFARLDGIVPATVDLAAVAGQCSLQGFDPQAFYGGLKRAGLDYGRGLQGLQTIQAGAGQILARVGPPAGWDSQAQDYGLHPILLEGALQACMVFVSAGNEAVRPWVPVALDSLTLASAGTGEIFAWVRSADGDEEADAGRFDIDILDREGRTCAVFRGLALAPTGIGANVPETAMMTPQWDVIREFDTITNAPAGQRVLILGADDDQRAVLQEHFREAVVTFATIETGDTIAARLSGIEFDRLVWIAAAHPVETLTEESIIADQERGILQVLRICRALTELGYEKRSLAWDIVTINSLPVRKADRINPTHAGLQGFSGSMAEVYPRWRIRLLDVQEFCATAFANMDRLPWRPKNSCYAQRGGEWFGQKLIPVMALPIDHVPYRNEGVYVVIGGSGGLGEIWTRHLIRHHQASVIWIGRRALDDKIRQKIAQLVAFGKTPEYIQADASNRQELEAAYEQIRNKYGVIHGIVHSAVGAFDQSLKTVSEDDFRSILSVKIDLSVRIAQVFLQEPLDFMVFFSSNAAFVRGAGMSGYSAGCTFKDAFALQLGKQLNYPIKVVNWGYWSAGAGMAMTDAMKAYFQEIGYLPLDPEEGMQALDRFLASGFDQMSIGRSSQPTAEHLDVNDEWMAGYSAGNEPKGVDLSSLNLTEKFQGIRAKAGQEMEVPLSRLLRGLLDATPDVLPVYRRWLLESRKIVTPYAASDAGAAPDLAQLWAEWDAALDGWLQDGGKKALCLLVDKCMRALPDILSGRQKATDVIFPKSSLELVESVYKTETLGLTYNDSLGDTLLAAVRARLQADPAASLRLLEIGAGTGATTAGILDKLEAYRTRIAEYCYTDISKAFLFHAENHYVPRAPYLRTQLFNVEQPIAQQGIAAGSYDFVIAANAVHATRNIRNTLRNVKAVLRKDGMLLMNEISDQSICGHVTFGLLDGWWLNEDDEIRIPGSPGLYPEAWQDVLKEEGFHSVQFPCQEVHAAGQQIVVALSDGIVRQKRPAPAKLQAVANFAASSRKITALAPAGVQPGSETTLMERTIQLCKQLIGQALKMDSQQIDAAEPLETYGIDSIIIGLVNQQLQKHFGDIGATLLYEFRTVNVLAGHLVETQRAALERLFELDRSAPATPVRVPAISDEILGERTVQFCKQMISKALKIGNQQLDAAESLERYGIDSVIISLVNQQLKKHFGDVGATLLYEFQTINALAGHLMATQREKLEDLFQLDRSAIPMPAPAIRLGGARRPMLQRGARVQAAGRQAIAIIGISGLYAQAANLDEFWENLKAGRNCITEIPSKRWFLEGFYEPEEQKAVDESKSYCKWGSFVDQFAQFDSLFFGISPREALNMDPQERLFIQLAWSALENSGYTRSALKQKCQGRVGVFAGITRAGYNLYRNAAASEDKFWPRTSFSSVANRLSYFMDFNGPSLPVDTMCSSSLTAIHEACEHIHNGDCDVAFAGGVNLYLHPSSYVDMSSQHMLSQDGLCRSFGAGANGFVPGEGVGVILLKALDRAVEDEDIIHGVILATCVNHGGKTNGFTVPNPVAQAELICNALDKAGISARDVSYIEAHGTGTELGDPIEIAGLQQAFARDTQDKGYCRIGSAKSNIGHLEAAAGIAGVTKVLLQMKHQQIAPTLHAATVNPHIKFERTAFQVNQTLASWERPVVDGKVRSRIAGISSFGAGGANAHVLIQEYSPVSARTSVAWCSEHPVIVPLSAKTKEQLQQKASDLLDFLNLSREIADLGAIAYTLQVGREAMEMRMGLVVYSVEQLVRSLSAYVDGEGDSEGIYSGQVQRKNDGLALFVQDEDMSEAIDRWIARKKYARLLELWVKGLDFDWQRLYGETRPQRIQLPTYPFARDEYWVDSVAPSRRADGAGKAEQLPAVGNLKMIEDIINQIGDASLEATQGVRLLKKLI